MTLKPLCWRKSSNNNKQQQQQQQPKQKPWSTTFLQKFVARHVFYTHTNTHTHAGTQSSCGWGSGSGSEIVGELQAAAHYLLLYECMCMCMCMCVCVENSVSMESALNCFALSLPKSKPLSRSLNANDFYFILFIFLTLQLIGHFTCVFVFGINISTGYPLAPCNPYNWFAVLSRALKEKMRKKSCTFSLQVFFFWVDTRQVRPVWQRKSNIKISLITYSNYGLRSCLFDSHSWTSIGSHWPTDQLYIRIG